MKFVSGSTLINSHNWLGCLHWDKRGSTTNYFFGAVYLSKISNIQSVSNVNTKINLVCDLYWNTTALHKIKKRKKLANTNEFLHISFQDINILQNIILFLNIFSSFNIHTTWVSVSRRFHMLFMTGPTLYLALNDSFAWVHTEIDWKQNILFLTPWNNQPSALHKEEIWILWPP